MRIVKIEHNEILDAVATEYDLDRAKVKSTRLGSAVIAVSNMHNNDVISDIAHKNRGYEVKPSRFDVDAINGL